MASPRRTTSMMLALLAAMVMVSGCGGADEGSSAGEQNEAAADNARPADSAGEGQVADGDDASASDTAARVLPGGRDIVYRGQISVRVKNVTTAANKVESLTGTVDGVVFSEESSNVPGFPSESSAMLTLRVPPTEFRPMLKKIAGLGERLSQSQTAEDVTTQVVDTKSRLATQQRSVARVRALLSEANTFGEVVQVEAELAKREADLESLQARLRSVSARVELATLVVRLEGGATPAVASATGFRDGLDAGWAAFLAGARVLAATAGAVLPFLPLVLVGALFGFWVNKRINDRLFSNTVYLIAFILGWYLLAEGVWQLRHSFG